MSASRAASGTGPEGRLTLVVGHANPDFDAYAATVAATRLFPGARGVFLGTQNANVREFHHLHEEFLDFTDLRGLDLARVERLVMVDTRDAGRIGELGPLAEDPGVELVVYDHHPPMAGDVTRGEDRGADVGATTSLLVHEIRERGLTLTPLEASLMLLGIHEDTGCLTYPGATAFDADAVAFLMAQGADMEVVNRFLTRSLTAEQRDLLDQLTASLELWDVHGRRVAVGVARTADYVDSAGVVTHHLVEDLGHRVAVAVIEMPERTHLVGRSRLHEVDIGAVLARLGGGGHAQAASAATRELPLPEVLSRLRAALEEVVRAPLTARDVGSAPVRTVTPETTMREAGDRMLRWGHGAMPVVAGEPGDDTATPDAATAVSEGPVPPEMRCVGLVTRKDVDKALRHGLGHAPVKGFMARDIVTVTPDTDLDTLEAILTRENIGRLPVIENGALVGIVTRKDVLRAEHGDAYLDRGLPTARSQATARFLESVEALLPEEVRGAIRALGALAEERGVRAYVVGGFVRDMLLGRRNLDVDIVVEGDAVVFADAAAERLGGRVKAHLRFGTAVLVLSRSLHVDVASARTEYYTRPGALPTVERSSLRQDLLRRDFSINAMAASIDPSDFGQIADPFGGLRDLGRGSIRALHSLSFVEDPTRVMRAARFERRFGFRMEDTTAALAAHAVEMGLLGDVSGARIRAELFAILSEEPAHAPLQRLDELGALAGLLPEGADPARALADVADVEACLHAMPGDPGRAVRRVPALLTAMAASADPREVQRWVHRLRVGRENAAAPVEAATRAAAVIRTLADAHEMRDSRLYATLHGLLPETLAYVRARACAQASALAGPEAARVRERVDRYLEQLAPVRAAVDGRDLEALGAVPSAAFSGILSSALADRLDGVAVGRDAELRNLARLAVRAGLIPDAS